MPRNIVEEQVTSLKTHPHVKKVQKVSSRLIKVTYGPQVDSIPFQNSLESQYKLKIELPLNYPDEPPTVKFMDPIEHLNICPQSGLVHQPLLMEEWSPYLSLYIIIDILDTLIAEPERDPKYCVNYQSLTISQIKNNSRRKPSQQSNSNRPQFSRKITRSFSRMEEFPAIVHQAFTEEEPFDIEVTQPVRPRKGLKRWKSFRCEKPFDYIALEANTQQEEQKKADKLNAHKLSLICEEVEQNSKVFELQGQNSPKASVIYPNPVQLRKDLNSINKEIVDQQPLFRTSRSPPTHRKLERKASNAYSPMHKMPALRRMNSIVDEDIQSNRTGAKTTQLSPSGQFNDLKSTTFFENSSHQLQHINRLLGVFTKQYEQLLQRRKMTSNQKLVGLIDSKVKQQLDMIVQLEQLSSQLKKGMMQKVKKDSNK